MAFSPMPVPTAWHIRPKQRCVHSPGTSSLLIPASLACANARAVRCAMLVLTAYLHPRGPVFDLVVKMVTMITMGGDLQPCCLADRLLTGLGQPQINS